MNLPFEPNEMSRLLLAWYRREGRDLPWRKSRDPYRVWLSEIMLQQTTVAAVIPYYERFLQRFPTLDTLASAPLGDVITLWAGLGYYSRARNLHRTAQEIVSEYGGVFPDKLESLMALPGIGRTTAGAILSIAFNKSAPILDGNVRRVLVRLFAWQDDPRSSRAEKQLWQWAETLTPVENPHDYAQAIMDLGATVCVPRTPICESCPLQELCQARQEGLTSRLPVSRKRQTIPIRKQVALAIDRSGALLLRQRATEGFLGGLWEFPSVELSTEQHPREAASRLLTDLGLSGQLNEAGDSRHAYSHFKLEVTIFRVVADAGGTVAENVSYRWCQREETEKLPLHGAHRKVFDKLMSDG